MDYFIEISSKTGMNAQKICIEAVRLLYKDYLNIIMKRKIKKGMMIKKNNNVNLNKITVKKKKKNCW